VDGNSIPAAKLPVGQTKTLLTQVSVSPGPKNIPLPWLLKSTL
jgi:hypothetical protein